MIVVTSSGARERVRLIGANTPETVKKDWPIEPFGPEASEYTKLRVEETGYVATLVADGNAYDQYNRRLAFV
ncbi:MAG: thermonuclease family protein, partial [Thermoguttaceae bacterium]|nr:thermonuclease family protein [Thermoguttaceae bacterium]